MNFMPILVYSIALLGMFMTLVLFFFFLITPKGNKNENRILAALILVFGLQIFIALSMGNYGYRYFLKPHLYIYALKLTCFTSGPLIFYYIKTFLNKNKSINFHLIHFIPFFCSLIFFGYFRFDIHMIGKTSVFINSLCLFQNLGYIIFSTHYIKKNNASFKSKLNALKDFSFMNWIHVVLFGYITIWIVQLNSLSIYVILRQPSWCAYTSSIFILIILLFTLVIMFLLLMKPEIYYAIKYKNNNLTELSKEEYLQQLVDYLKLNKAYSDPDISLEKIANDLSIKPRLLSQVINELCKKNFKSFLNDFRINECIRLFSEDTSNRKTIQEVYYMAGFNSRSVFNELFKGYTGLTPKEFKEKINVIKAD
jgi:AraC-like DNA-binding protein